MAHNNNMFAERLKEIRNHKGLSQRKLALDLSVDRTAVTKWEQGKREPSFEMLVKIADYFGVSCDFLLGRTEY